MLYQLQTAVTISMCLCTMYNPMYIVQCTLQSIQSSVYMVFVILRNKHKQYMRSPDGVVVHCTMCNDRNVCTNHHIHASMPYNVYNYVTYG